MRGWVSEGNPCLIPSPIGRHLPRRVGMEDKVTGKVLCEVMYYPGPSVSTSSVVDADEDEKEVLESIIYIYIYMAVEVFSRAYSTVQTS